MSQALYTSMSGINAGTRQIEVVSNNVANINTTAFKSSSINFADVYSTTISYGSVASGASGGTNPIQIGVGVKTSAITKDFSNGSVVSTGKATDLMIQGKGFFAVKSTDNQIFYTRAGDFSWDNKGNLVTSAGYKVLGTSTISSNAASSDTVKVPTSVVASVEGNTSIGTKKVTELNALSTNITQGTFTVSDGTNKKTITLSSTDLAGTVQDLCTAINTKLGADSPNPGDPAIKATASCDKGMITFEPTGTATDLSFGETTDTSNFLTATGLSTAIKDTNDKYNSNILDYECNISDITSSAAVATGINSIAINNDGSVQATYQNGGTLSVQIGSDKKTYEFVYTTEEGVQITGNDVSVKDTVAKPSNFVIQMANVTNTDGLLSVGSNLFKAGPNTGTVTYTVGNNMGVGAIASGSLEASNVDLSEELSDMILAQRAVQANSRVFTTTSNVLETVTNMGR